MAADAEVEAEAGAAVEVAEAGAVEGGLPWTGTRGISRRSTAGAHFPL